ncbi:MAG: DNA-3-methyladenine glycosylase family protein [Chloroflexota bacterium]
MRARTIQFEGPLDVARIVSPLRRGLGDPTLRLAARGFVRATRTPAGPATLEVELLPGGIRARAWGPGADWSMETLPGLVGLEDDRTGWKPAHRLLADLDRRLVGLRLGHSRAIFEALWPAILEQKVAGDEARRAFRGLVRHYGEPPPGPFASVVRLPPEPAVLAGLPYHAYHPYGVERRRADTVRAAAARASWLEASVELPLADAYARLRSLPGVGAWTAAEVAARALGDPDAVSVGDFHLPNLVAWALAREPRADDARMLELLEPYRGQRARAIRLLEASGLRPPRYAPRLAPRRIEAM